MLHLGTRIKVNALTSGLTDFTLGTAVNSSFQNFAAAGTPDGSIIDYVAATSSQFETGTGIYNAGAGTLSRAVITASSSGGAKVNFTGNPVVGSSYLPRRHRQRNADYLDIHDFGTLAEIEYSDITAALNAAIAYGQANHIRRIRISPLIYVNGTVQSKLSLLGALTWPEATIGETTWIIEIDIQSLLVGTTITPPPSTVFRGINQTSGGGVGINGPQQCLVWTHAPAGTGGSPGIVFCNPIIHWTSANKMLMDNIGMISGNGTCCIVHRQECGMVRDCGFASGGGSAPALIVDGGFWVTLERVAAGRHGSNTSPYAMALQDTNLGSTIGLVMCRDIRLVAGSLLISGTIGAVNGIYFDDIISEDIPAGGALVTLQAQVGNLWFNHPFGGNADPVDANDNWNINVLSGATVNGLNVWASPWTGPDYVIFKPGSASVRNLVVNTTVSQNQDSTAARIEDNMIATGHHHNFRISYPSAEDVKLLTAPVSMGQAMGNILPIPQDPTLWTKLSGTDYTSGILAPDGTTNAVMIAGGTSYRPLYVNNIVATTGDWFLIACWAQMPGTTSNAKVINSGIKWDSDGAGIWNNAVSSETGLLATCNEDYVVNHGWRFLCKAYKLTGTGLADSFIFGRLILNPSENTHYFGLCGVNLGQVKDRWALNVAKSLKNSWSPTVTRRGTWGAMDHQATYAGQGLMLKEGVTAPATLAGVGQLYIEGGAIKMKLGDGTVRTFTVT